MIVVEAERPSSEALHVLLTAVALKGAAPTFCTSAELTTDPVGPVVPWVLTVREPV